MIIAGVIIGSSLVLLVADVRNSQTCVFYLAALAYVVAIIIGLYALYHLMFGLKKDRKGNFSRPSLPFSCIDSIPELFREQEDRKTGSHPESVSHPGKMPGAPSLPGILVGRCWITVW